MKNLGEPLLELRATLFSLLFLLNSPANAENSAINPERASDVPLTKLSLQELRNVEVTAVSRKEEKLLNAPSAVYVLEEEDIRRSGVTSIPEALRMAPGLNVAQINANKWAISARGLNNRFANKQLVLMDGRTVYTPVFSGVYWDVIDYPLEDLDRIEVIRGPGGTLWGANAVNGVISIVSKSARETQGLLLSGGYGSEEQGSGNLRYGGKLSDDLYYRVYVRGFDRDDFHSLNGGPGADEWWQQREGFRMDWTPGQENHFTLQGDYYYGRSGDQLILATPNPPFRQAVTERARAEGYNLLARWTHTLSESSDYSLQIYYDRNNRHNSLLNARINTIDVDFQHLSHPLERNEVIWGAGYRLIIDEIQGSYSAQYAPIERHDQLFSAFIQDQITLVSEKLFFTPGTKIEHNDYTGWEIQPSGRLSLKATENQTLWAAVSRAVRTPARFEEDATANVIVPRLDNAVARLSGNSDLKPEKLNAYELGYKIQPIPRLFLDLSIFYNEYDDLRSTDLGQPILGRPLIIPGIYKNDLSGETYGVEFAPTWQVFDNWRLSAGYSLLRVALHKKGGTDVTSEGAEGDSPENQFHIRSFLDLPHHLQLDTALYYVESLGNQRVPSYTRVDVRLGWSARRHLELSVALQNIFNPQHTEFGATTPLVTPTEIERSIYGKVTWRF